MGYSKCDLPDERDKYLTAQTTVRVVVYLPHNDYPSNVAPYMQNQMQIASNTFNNAGITIDWRVKNVTVDASLHPFFVNYFSFSYDKLLIKLVRLHPISDVDKMH